MSEVFTEIVKDRSAWRGPELAGDESWIYRFSAPQLDELDEALHRLKARGPALEDIGRADFPLPTLGPKLLEHLEEVRTGRGFVLLRGIPVHRYSVEDLGLLYYGLGTHLGDAVRQNAAGDILGHVRNQQGKQWGNLDVRGYESAGHLVFHSDFSDIVGLLSVRHARSGGLSMIASSITVHNELLEHWPDYLPTLYRGFRYIKREAVGTDDPVTGRIPVFGHKDGYLSCRIVRARIDSACRRMGEPLDPLEAAALDGFAALADSDEIHLAMDLLPGDIQLLNNYTILHSRTAFEDGPEPDQQRHLLRLWLSLRERRRPLPADFPQSNGYAVTGAAALRGARELGLAVG